jgi:K+-sensing histidine kinase KdpD
MSVADLGAPIRAFPPWLQTWPRRYAFALLAVTAATVVRFLLGLGFGLLPPFVVFFPTIILVALLAGFWPAILAILLSAASAAAFFWTPLNLFGINRLRDIVSLGLFCGI